MAEQHTETEAPSLGVLAEITARLAAITPEQFIVPEFARSGDAVFVCMASDDIKRIFTLRSTLTDEMDQLVQDGLTASLDALLEVSARNLHEIFKEMQTPGSRTLDMTQKMLNRRCAMQKQKRLCEIVDNLLWLEIRRQHADLKDRSQVGIFSDWGLYWLKDEPYEKILNMAARINSPFSPGRQPGQNLN